MSETTTGTTITDVLQYISLHATAEDIDRIYDVAKLRSKAHRAARAASVKAGQRVKIVKISPKALVGLTGVVSEHDGKHGKVLLDTRSTRDLMFSRTRYAARITSDMTEYVLPGVPLSCMEVQD